MACVHAMALGAVWIGGLRGAGEPTTEGGHILVTLMPEPVALPGEAKEGAAVEAAVHVALGQALQAFRCCQFHYCSSLLVVQRALRAR